MTSDESDDMDALLRTALQARPEPAIPHDLAHRAIALAEVGADRTASLMRLGKLMRWSSAIAGGLVAAVLAIGIWLYPATESADTTAASSAVSSASSLSDAAPVGVLILAIALVGVAMRMLLEAEPRRTLSPG